MLSYCLKCRKNKESKTLKVVPTKPGTIIFRSNCIVCNCKKSKFLKEQEAKGIWDELKRLPSPFLWNDSKLKRSRFYDIKEKTKVQTIKQCFLIVWSVEKIRVVKIKKL